MKRILIALSIFAVLNANYADAKKRKSSKKVTLQNAESKKNEFLSAKQAVLIDFDTAEILYERDAKERCAPSSMTKLLTTYILFSALKDGRLKMDDELPVSEHAQSMEGSRSFFKAGTSAKVEDLVRSIIVHSGNDACVIVAEALSGDMDIFAEEMNRKAAELGLKDSHFMNPSGLPDEEHYSTVYDLALIARRLIKDFPEYYHYFAEKEFRVNGITQQNRNTLLGNSMGVDGLKTGHTRAGGYGIVVSTIKDGKRLIAVVNGCTSTKARAQDSGKLLAFGYREFIKFKPIKAGIPITSLKVWLGDKGEVNVCSHEDISITVPRKFQNSIKAEATMIEPAEAPIKLGAKVGYLTYRYGDFISKKYDLFSCNEVKQANWFERAKVSVMYLLFGNSSAPEKNGKSVVLPNE